MFSRGKLMSAASVALLSGTLLVPSSMSYAMTAPEAAALVKEIIPEFPALAAPSPDAAAPVERPAVGAPAKPARPAEQPEAEDEDDQSFSAADLECMTKIILYEAGSEIRDGQVAVAQVVMNRVKSPRFPNSVCGVIYQRGQFASIRSFSHPRNARWQRAQAIAREVLEGDEDPVVGRALYFHAARVRPAYVQNHTRVAQVGNHIFYR